VRVDRFNPFEVNRVGENGPGFPLSIEVQRRGAVWTATGTALRAEDMAPLLVSLGGPVALIFNVGHADWFDDQGSVIPSGAIAKRQGVDAEVHDIRWTSLSRGSPPADLLVVATSDLDRFFDGWSPYDVDVVDLPTRPTREAVEEVVLVVNTFGAGEPPVLSSVKGASTYFSGHDDCYFYAESRTNRIPQMILCRLLALLAGSALLRGQTYVDVPEPSLDLAAELLSLSDRWVGLATLRPGGDVTVDLSPAGWRLGQPIPQSPTVVAVLDAFSGAWSICR
jgi:hypothetical protein